MTLDAPKLQLPTGVIPLNLSLPPGVRAVSLESDVHGICTQIREISPDLRIVLLEGEDDYCFAVMEDCHDGVSRLVFKIRELDGRVVKRLQKLMALSLNERLVAIEKEHHRLAEQEHEAELDDLWERIGRPMWTDLEKTGFIQRPVSYPKAGVATSGRKRK